jgi:hypothetical protein
MSRVSIPLSNLRAVVIVVVVAFHSMLPYLTSQPAHPFPFDVAPYRWVAFPIIDQQRFFGFDLFCAWQDVSLMSLMFLLAGLFTPASLARKGSLAYVVERWWRIGLPFVAIARAIVANPSVVLADEPTSSLDSANGRTILQLLADAAHEQGQAVLVVTHDPRIVQFADRIVYIEDGRIVDRPSGEAEPMRLPKAATLAPLTVFGTK